MANKEIFDIINLVRKEETTKNEKEKSFDETNREEQKNKKTRGVQDLGGENKGTYYCRRGQVRGQVRLAKEDTQQTEQ